MYRDRIDCNELLFSGQNIYYANIGLFLDRYIIVGCHYDAWSYGGVDPNTGIAVLIEVASALTKLAAKGFPLLSCFLSNIFCCRTLAYVII